MTSGISGEKMVPKNVVLFRRARDMGGVAYPISTIPFTRADWARHFGPEWPVLTAAMRRFDPTEILCPGQPMHVDQRARVDDPFDGKS
jgi:FAD/FMN-containing dehydrogenase